MATRILAALLAVSSLALLIYFGLVSRDGSEGVAWRSREASVSALDTEMRERSREIQAAAGKGRCDADSNCRVIGLGTRVCGQFKDFLVYSTLDVNESELVSLVSSFNAAHGKLSNLSLAAERCGSAPSRARCVRRRCTAQPAS